VAQQADREVDLLSRLEVIQVSTTLRLLSVRLLLVLLGVALAAVALVAGLSPAGSGHGTTVGAGYQGAGKVSQQHVEWR